jgi:hypothetical protein
MLTGLCIQAAGGDQAILGYVNTVPPETLASSAARLHKVAERRRGTPILVHRGAWQIAPENTLEAYAAAMDYGADGVEIDIRRSKDGVLYLLHDDTLDRTTSGTGKASDLTYYQLLQFTAKGAPGGDTRIPTLAAVLVLVRQRAALLHLDVKEPGLQDDIIRMLDAADVWDHIVEVNAGNAERIRSHPKVKLLAYKGWIPGDYKQPDWDAVKAFLNQPGRMVFCEDPRLAAKALGRPEYSPMPVPDGLRVYWTPDGVAATGGGGCSPVESSKDRLSALGASGACGTP